MHDAASGLEVSEKLLMVGRLSGSSMNVTVKNRLAFEGAVLLEGTEVVSRVADLAHALELYPFKIESE
eukprot:1265812-Lingulodinium_polyedra.AAC.1